MGCGDCCWKNTACNGSVAGIREGGGWRIGGAGGRLDDRGFLEGNDDVAPQRLRRYCFIGGSCERDAGRIIRARAEFLSKDAAKGLELGPTRAASNVSAGGGGQVAGAGGDGVMKAAKDSAGM